MEETWQHTVALAVETMDADFDLYVTVMDGRYPTETDYDFKSTNRGADVIFLSPDEPSLSFNNPDSWNPEVGLLVVVGVKAVSEKEAVFTLFYTGPEKYNHTVQEITSHDKVTIPVRGDNTTTKENPKHLVFKWYNWGHTNFRISLRTIGGSFKIYMNSLSETQYEKNIITAIGMNSLNADWWAELSNEEGKRDRTALVIKRADTDGKPAFCYNCWYYFTVVIDHEENTAVQIEIEQGSAGGDMAVMERNERVKFDLQSSKKRERLRFMLTSTDPFEIQTLVKTGQVSVKIALDPFLVTKEPIWSADNIDYKYALDVGTEDPKFHLNTWYFVVLEWTAGLPAEGWIRVKQQRSVSYLANGIPKKMQFLYDRELVKFAVFQVPALKSTIYVEVEGLSPHSYPTIYLKHVELKEPMMDLEMLDYPSMDDYEMKLFDDYDAQTG